MRVYNTLSGQKEELIPLNPPEINMYVCGPTTYNYIHLGNARPLAVFDTVRRYLEYRGYKVNYVQNFTDVDDKIINRAREENEDPLQVALKYIDEYFADADALGIRRANIHPKVSEHMPDIVAAVEQLINRGYAYEVEGDVFFRVSAFKPYGKLSKRTPEDMLAGARVEVNEVKENPVDFALWKKAKPQEPSWDSPWGQGRPGWHIECSVMSTKYLGDAIDIHGGGNDLIFPHHENEIAQAEALTGKQFVRYWMHNGFITVNSEKMSKSLGNFFVLRDIFKLYPPDVVRFYLIATHYRSPLDFDNEKLEEAKKALTRLKNTLLLMDDFLMGKTADKETGNATVFTGKLAEIEQNFVQAMDDDFNTALALGHYFEMSHTINSYLAAADKDDQTAINDVAAARRLYFLLGDLLGIYLRIEPQKNEIIEAVLDIFAQERKVARQQKNYALADELRDYLRELNIQVEDLAGGVRFKYEDPPEPSVLADYLFDLAADEERNSSGETATRIYSSLAQAGFTPAEKS